MGVSDIGPVGLARAAREGCLVPLTGSVGCPVDVQVSPTLRALALAPEVPRGAAITGLAGLWLRHGGELPATIDVVRRRGSRGLRPAQYRARRVRIHAQGAAAAPSESIGPLTVASTARCLVDALRWAPLSQTIPAVWRELRAGTVREHEVTGELLAVAPDRSRMRAASAWRAVLEAWGDADRSDRDGHAAA